MASYPKVLIVTTNHVGNNLFCTPAIRLLKKHWPTTQLDVVAMSARGADVFVENPDITGVFTSTRQKKIRKLAAHYPLVIGLHHDKAQKYLTGLSVPTIAVPPPDPNRHRAQTTLEFMRDFLNCSLSASDECYVLPTQTKHQTAIAKHLTTTASEILIGLHLGCGRTAVHGWKIWYKRRDQDPKLWPLEKYIKLGELLTAADPRIKLVITGSSNEKFLGRKFVKALPSTINLMGKTSLFTLAALMQYLNIFITQDTGALHVACTTEIPIIGLFGPTNPAHTGFFPLRPQHTILKKETMLDIKPEEVAKAVLQKLN